MDKQELKRELKVLRAEVREISEDRRDLLKKKRMLQLEINELKRKLRGS